MCRAARDSAKDLAKGDFETKGSIINNRNIGTVALHDTTEGPDHTIFEFSNDVHDLLGIAHLVMGAMFAAESEGDTHEILRLVHEKLGTENQVSSDDFDRIRLDMELLDSMCGPG